MIKVAAFIIYESNRVMRGNRRRDGAVLIARERGRGANRPEREGRAGRTMWPSVWFGRSAGEAMRHWAYRVRSTRRKRARSAVGVGFSYRLLGTDFNGTFREAESGVDVLSFWPSGPAGPTAPGSVQRVKSVPADRSRFLSALPFPRRGYRRASRALPIFA